MQEQWSEKTTTRATTSLPKTLFCGKFNLTETAFQAGLLAGEYFEVEEEDGSKTYAWTQSTQATKSGVKDRTSVGAQAKASAGDVATFTKLANMWQKGLGAVAPAGSQQGGKKQPKALCDGDAKLTQVEWERAQAQLNMAMQSFDKLIKSAKTHLQTTGHDPDDAVFPTLLLGY